MSSDTHIEEDLHWIYKMASPIPSQEHFEMGAQALAIFREVNRDKIKMSNESLLKVSVAGWIASRIRVIDEDKFLNTPPYYYLRVAQNIVQSDWGLGDDSENEYNQFISNILI